MKLYVMLCLAVGLISGCLRPLGLPAPMVSIEPANPGPDDDLVLVSEEIPSGEDRPVITWQIEWQQDGVTFEDLAGAELVPSARTEMGETWTAVVAAVQGAQVGPTSQASVVIGATGDDDDSGDDDDDDDVSPGGGTGTRLCAAAGTVTDGIYIASTCTGPVEIAPGVVSDGTYTIHINKLAPRAK